MVTYWYGLLPAHATAVHGRAFSQLCEFGAVTSAGVGDFVFYDADILCVSGERTGDEVIPTDPATALKDLNQLPVRSGRARRQRQADRRDHGRADSDPQSTRTELARTGLLVVILRAPVAGAALGPAAGRQSDPGRPRPYPMMVQVRPIPRRYVGDRR